MTESASSSLSAQSTQQSQRYSANQDDWSQESREAYAQILERRGAVSPPFRALIGSPEVALQYEALSSLLWKGSVPAAVLESLFLVISRRFHCDEQWRRHAPKAIAAQVPQESIDQIAQGQVPDAPHNVRQAILLAEHLLDGKKIPNAIWNEAAQTFGQKGLSEICAFLGAASIVAMSINIQEVAD